jgi:hypothetical protein
MDISFPTYLWAVPLFIVVGFFLGALILQAACALGNVEVGFRKAIGLNLLMGVINIPVSLGFGYLAGFLGTELGMPKDVLAGSVSVIDLFLTWTICGFIFSLLLPISFFKGILIAVLDGVIWLVLAGIVGGLILVVLACMQLAA